MTIPLSSLKSQRILAPAYTYKDFVTGKMKYTRGTFMGWTEPTGLLKAKYAIFQRRSSKLFVPEYLLSEQAKLNIRQLVEEQNGKLTNQTPHS